MSDDQSDAAAALHEQASEALASLDFVQARALATEARALFASSSGDDHPDVASTDLLLSRIARDTSDYALALTLADRASEALAAAHREYPDEPVVVTMIAEAAAQRCAICISLGQYAQAEQAAADALPLVESTLGETEAVATLCNALGMAHKYLANWDTAAAHYARAYRILESEYGADGFELASLEHNLGGLAHARGEPQRAEPHARRSVELRERELGPDHPEVAADLAAWAAILDDLHELERAEAAYQRALEIFRRVHGDEHYEVGFTRGALGALYAGAERWDEAHAQLSLALQTQQALLGPDHPDVALLHHYLAVVEHARGALAAAAAHARHALRVFGSLFPADHPRVLDAREVERAIARHR